jgi:hypothetical protein
MIIQSTNISNDKNLELANGCVKQEQNFNTIWGTEYFIFCADEIKEEDAINLIKGMLLMREFRL